MLSVVIVCFALATKWQSAWSCHAPLRVVDLTHVFDNTTLNIPTLKGFQSNVLFLEDQEGKFQVEEFTSSTHAGTHIDAPCHYGRHLETVTDIPFDKLIAPAAVVDICDKVSANPEYELQIDDLLRWEQKTGVLLNDVILLVRSGWSKNWSNRAAYMGNPNNDTYDFHYPGIAVSTLRWLVSKRNVYGVGVESLTPHADPFKDMAHVILNGNSIYVIENVADMSKLPLFGATVYVIPMKMGGACGAPTRIFATFPDPSYKRSKNATSSRRKRNPLLK